MNLWRRTIDLLRFLCVLAWLGLPGLAIASEYHGQVTLGGLPVSGVSVTAVQGAKKTVAVTDTQGIYSFPNLADGTWTVNVEMTGFSPMQQEVAVSPDTPAGKWEIKMLSLDQIRAAAKPVKTDANPVTTANAAAPVVPATGAKSPDSKAVASAATPASAAPAVADENAPRAADGLLINGSVNNAATSQFAMAQAFGNTRSGSRALYNGSIGLTLDNSALDASPYSITGVVTAKPSYNQITGLATLGGPIKIPHLLLHGPNFFLGYQWTRIRNDSTQPALVPDAAERMGNLSELPAQIYNPATGLAYAGNLVPISPQAQALLNLYPLPNLAGSTRYNYQTDLVSNTHSDAMQLHMDKSITPRNQVYGQFNLQSSRASSDSIFNFLDTTDALNFSGNVNYSHRFKQRLFLLSTYQFSRSRNRVTPFFGNRTNVSQAAGITGNDQDAADWGPPSLSFSSGIVGLSDTQSANNRNETNSITEELTWSHLRHNVTVQGSVRRQEFNYLTQQNPRGSFTFTGAATQTTGGIGGSDFADFLVGVPDVSSIAFGNADKYLRQSAFFASVTDDWRVRPELTLNMGIRWEYGAPITELKNRLVNLDTVSGFAAVAPLLASSPKGSLSGQSYPTSLIRPDRVGFQPRIGLSWRPISGSSVVVRAGYGITNDTSVYQATALAMAQQAPLSKSLSVSNSAACPLTLAAGFNPCATTTADTFAVDPNFRIGYLQTWQLQVQRDLPHSLLFTATYLANKGTHGVQQFLPNTYPTGSGVTIPGPSGFSYRTSGGDSTRESGILEVRRRLHNGFTAKVNYVYSKSIDDDSVIGGQGAVATGSSGAMATSSIAQNWLDLHAERGLSTFDQRHLVNVTMQYTTGMGLGGRTLMSGWKGVAYKDWTVLSTISVGSGLPETPTYLAPVLGTGFTNIIRPNLTGAPIYAANAGYFLNPNAYAAPAAGQWGDARRDSITGPDQFTLNASASRTFRLHDRYNLDVRVDSTNTLNHVTYTGYNTSLNPIASSTLNQTSANPLFGLPVAANTMRRLTATMRLRF